MKKIIFLLLLSITLILCGCNKKINIQVTEYCGGIYLEDEHSNRKSYDRFYEVIGATGCYLFKDYNDFDNFINENNLLMEKEIESKYSQDFFLDKSMILYFEIDPSSGYSYKFNLYNNKDNILKFEINR